jgi:regulator of protease activity HflC (stomatin/prohibitin superfamily)
MGDFLRIILDSIAFCWPGRIVETWERGGWYVCGRWWKDVGPGCYFLVPWFMEIRSVSIAPAPVVSGRQDITLSDNSVLSFDAVATMRVVDVRAALNDIEDYHHSTITTLGAVLSDKLAEVDVARLEWEKRGRLFTSLEKWVGQETAQFGVETTNLRFTSFVLRAKVHRLLLDQSALAQWI